MNIAIIGVGILAGKDNQGIPAFIEALKVLSGSDDVTVYSFIPIDKAKTPPGIRVRHVSSRRIPQKLQFLILCIQFIVDHLRHPYEIIHAQSPFPAGLLAEFLSRKLSIPWMLSFHAGEAALMPDVPFGDLLNPFLAKHNLRVSKRAKFLMAMSEFQAEQIRKNLGVREKIFILPRGIVVPPLEFKQASLSITILHISYFDPIKDHRMMLLAFKEISERISAKLVIVGSNYSNEFRGLIKELNIEGTVELKGTIANHDIREVFRQADFLIHTSRFEGLPMVALEAMAHGVVVCGTHVGIMADLSPGCCWTVTPGNHIALADKIVSLVHDRAQYDTLRRKAHEWITEHDMNWYIKELRSCYRQVMNMQ